MHQLRALILHERYIYHMCVFWVNKICVYTHIYTYIQKTQKTHAAKSTAGLRCGVNTIPVDISNCIKIQIGSSPDQTEIRSADEEECQRQNCSTYLPQPHSIKTSFANNCSIAQTAPRHFLIRNCIVCLRKLWHCQIVEPDGWQHIALSFRNAENRLKRKCVFGIKVMLLL